MSCQAGPGIEPGPSALKASALPIELTWQTSYFLFLYALGCGFHVSRRNLTLVPFPWAVKLFVIYFNIAYLLIHKETN